MVISHEFRQNCQESYKGFRAMRFKHLVLHPYRGRPEAEGFSQRCHGPAHTPPTCSPRTTIAPLRYFCYTAPPTDPWWRQSHAQLHPCSSSSLPIHLENPHRTLNLLQVQNGNWRESPTNLSSNSCHVFHLGHINFPIQHRIYPLCNLNLT